MSAKTRKIVIIVVVVLIIVKFFLVRASGAAGRCRKTPGYSNNTITYYY